MNGGYLGERTTRNVKSQVACQKAVKLPLYRPVQWRTSLLRGTVGRLVVDRLG